MIETENQRRWWFATHPEFSSRRTGQRWQNSADALARIARHAPQDPAKEAFISHLMAAGWSRERAESRWTAFKLNETIARGVGRAVSVYGAIGGARAILNGVYRWATSGARAITRVGSGNGLTPVPRGDLNPTQFQNFRRFENKLPAGASKTAIFNLSNGGKIFRAEVPGQVPGSKAIYEKQVDIHGRTTGYTKTTIAPDGQVVHIKDKFNK